MTNTLDRIEVIVALDVGDMAHAKALVQSMPGCDYYKVGLELFAAEGPRIVEWLRDQNKRVFVDLKLHDIPNTVRHAARSVARLGASLVTVHACGGTAMIRAAVDGAGEGSSESSGDNHCDVVAVTVLTSLDDAALATAWGREAVNVETEVLRLGQFARDAGAAGVVCSGHEVKAIRTHFKGALDALVPGIRTAGGTQHDQARVATPTSAISSGARWLVIGRAATEASDPGAAIDAIKAEAAAAFENRDGFGAMPA